MTSKKLYFYNYDAYEATEFKVTFDNNDRRKAEVVLDVEDENSTVYLEVSKGDENGPYIGNVFVAKIFKFLPEAIDYSVERIREGLLTKGAAPCIRISSVKELIKMTEDSYIG